MIKSIRHKALRQLWEEGKTAKLPKDQLKRISQILKLLDEAKVIPQDFTSLQMFRIHPLVGNLKGYWSLTVKENWRIIFTWDGTNVNDVDYIDYH
ncbi:type II toxin-antitoxin system mRNA interferase toxin, RelE/StbE family [Pseudoflavitalea sp. X16]|uniref:type II toxin-antitoxin system RelE/ParE family toxin n=1 Tax=Paraflavitalea devenefica TaxID=2716334 RepID=UPI0014238314|nr:type II toxin-antitoxin system mRNA interferase toxin, RelE/StbE family [Paraflavitalea devenefica]NII25434.1 type II toxin-antitoxin system mRNA interferase toxin, RelE/StbE family [Paraflavitalea devenefica]